MNATPDPLYPPDLFHPDTLGALGEALDMNLSLEQRGVPVGPYYADLVANDGTNRVVIVPTSDDTRLNIHHQTLTFLDGLAATVFIFVADKISNRRRQELAESNKLTRSTRRLYGVETTPKLRVVVGPENPQGNGVHAEIDETGIMKDYRRFWTEWKSYIARHEPELQTSEVVPSYWNNISTHRHDVWFSLRYGISSGELGCHLCLGGPQANGLWQNLVEQKADIEADTGQLVWMKPVAGMPGSVSLETKVSRAEGAVSWAEEHHRLYRNLKSMRAALADRLT